MRRWPLALGLATLLGIAGFFIGGTMPSTITAEARVAAGPGDMSSGAIAGFPEATRSMAEDYARWVTSSSIEGGGPKVSATPVPDSNVIAISSESGAADQAKQAAQQAAERLVQQVNSGRDSTNPAKTLAEVKKLSATWALARAELTAAEQRMSRSTTATATSRAAYAEAAGQEAYLKVQLDAQTQKYQSQVSNASQAADLRIVQSAAVVKDSATSLRARYALFGVALGLLTALIVATLLDRRRFRRVVDHS